MAGRAVFKAAQNGQLNRLTRLQAALATHAPAVLRMMIFANAPRADKTVFATPQTKAILTDLLRDTLTTNRAEYHTALAAYVKDWRALLPHITAPVTLWHGTSDTWAPIAMSQYLAETLPNATLTPLPNFGHYSALTETLPKLP